MKQTRKLSVLVTLCAVGVMIASPLAPLAPLAPLVPLVTAAAYTDQAKGGTPATGAHAVVTQTARFTPTTTYLANTATAIQNGTLWIWGFRGNGLSGTGVATVASNAVPSAAVIPQTGYVGGAHKRHVVKVAAVSLDNFSEADVNYTGMAALSDDGIVYTWGGNQTVNIMGRTAADYNTPAAVSIPGTVVDLVSSASVFMALTSTGDLYTWGYPQAHGVTGQGTTTSSSVVPTLILTGVHSIGAGTWNGWAIRSDNNLSDPLSGVFWWGWANTTGSFAGDPSGDDLATTRSVPTKSTALSPLATSGCNTDGVIANSAADTCTLRSLSGHYFGNQALTSAGVLYGWGTQGTVYGTGRSAAPANTPLAVTIPGNPLVSQVALTEDYVLLLTTGGQVFVYGRYSWASGPDPVTGLRSVTDPQTPTLLSALPTTASDIGGFGYSAMARLTDGRYYVWGGSQQGINNNLYSSVRNAWATSSTPTGASQGLTLFTQPGV